MKNVIIHVRVEVTGFEPGLPAASQAEVTFNLPLDFVQTWEIGDMLQGLVETATESLVDELETEHERRNTHN